MVSKADNNLYFLSGGGEMGALIRAKDWRNTSLGDPKLWPQSLQTMVAVMLDNPFGMYIAWGKEYIQLYNDGYRPILGSTKHPQALGISTRETFAEIWHIIGSMFDQVMQGAPVGFPDFMLPLNRNGFVEECYFDFSYSPIRKDDGEVGGVLVTVIETTNKKKAEEALIQSEERFRAMAENIPNLAWMAHADGGIFWYNKKWYEYTGTTPEQMQGWGWQSVHDPETLPAVLLNWRDSIANGQPFEMVFPLKGTDGRFRQFLTRILPVYDREGKITQWFGSNTDITRQIEAEQNLRNTILQAPVAMCIFRGPNHVVELANERMY
ncbi:MAG: PAS domain-containing protein, partial [Saprospiraceae bacterium]